MTVERPLAVTLVDLLLAGDNAVILALVSVSLRLSQARQIRVLLLGTGFAVVLRVALTAVSGQLLLVPGLRLVGGLALAVLAVNLARPRAGAAPAPVLGDSTGLVGLAVLIGAVDLLMSLDNVLAVAAIAGDDPVALLLGLTLSIAILMFGATLVARLLRRLPDLVWVGTALLGWVAGRMLVSDGLVSGWIDTQSPALAVIVPGLLAFYVYLLSGDPVAVPAMAPRAVRLRRPEPVTLPPRHAPAAAAPETVEDAGSGHAVLIMLAAVFAIGGGLLFVLLLFGGGQEQ